MKSKNHLTKRNLLKTNAMREAAEAAKNNWIFVADYAFGWKLNTNTYTPRRNGQTSALILGSTPLLRTFFKNLIPPSRSLPSGVNNLLHCWGVRACFVLRRDHGDLSRPRSEEEQEAGEEEVTTNRTERKWIHDDDDEEEEDDGDDDRFEDDVEVWLRLRALIYLIFLLVCSLL